jgi:hypothetical protein
VNQKFDASAANSWPLGSFASSSNQGTIVNTRHILSFLILGIASAAFRPGEAHSRKPAAKYSTMPQPRAAQSM